MTKRHAGLEPVPPVWKTGMLTINTNAANAEVRCRSPYYPQYHPFSRRGSEPSELLLHNPSSGSRTHLIQFPKLVPEPLGYTRKVCCTLYYYLATLRLDTISWSAQPQMTVCPVNSRPPPSHLIRASLCNNIAHSSPEDFQYFQLAQFFNIFNLLQIL